RIGAVEFSSQDLKVAPMCCGLELRAKFGQAERTWVLPHERTHHQVVGLNKPPPPVRSGCGGCPDPFSYRQFLLSLIRRVGQRPRECPPPVGIVVPQVVSDGPVTDYGQSADPQYDPRR